MLVLYTIGCLKCDILEEKLNNKNINFTICNDQDVMREKGITTLPMLEVDGNLMNFKEANDWVNQKG